MSFAQPLLHIPTKTQALLEVGALTRVGSVVKWTDSMRFHSFLKEVDLPPPEAASNALIARLTSASKGQLALAITGASVVLVGGALAASNYVKKRRAAVKSVVGEDVPECVISFEASLRAYVDAGRAGELDATVLDNLIVDLDSVKAFMEVGNEVLISLDNLVPIFDLVIAHTPKLAAACGVDSPELDEDDSEGGGIVPLRRHLEAQKTILAEAA